MRIGVTRLPHEGALAERRARARPALVAADRFERAVVAHAFLAAAMLAAPPFVDPVSAQSAGVEQVIVSGTRENTLDAASETGSRLGLSVRETPAALDVLTQERFLERGLATSSEALNSAPGVTATNPAGSPGSVSMRGFGGAAVSQNYDGVHQPSTMVTRNYDTFAFDRIEILKGPASVLYGEGAIGGAVNFVPKKPEQGTRSGFGLAQYGNRNTFRIAGDYNFPLGERAAARAIVSYAGSDGFIDRADKESVTANFGVMLEPSEDLSIFVAAEHFWNTDTAAYWGTPLVPAAVARAPSDLIAANGLVLDEVLLDVNFQYQDALVRSDSTWLRSQINWTIGDVWSLRSDLAYNDGDRLWDDAEGYSYNETTQLVDRQPIYIRNFLDFWNARLAATADAELGGRRNRFLVGIEHTYNDHLSVRRFGLRTPADPYDYVPGVFPEITPENFPGGGNFADAGAKIRVSALFVENALNITDHLLLVVGGRVEDMKLERDIRDFNLDTYTAYDRSYSPFTYRAGLVYSLSPRTQIYGQYSAAAAPVGTMVLMSLANTNFELTKGKSAEIGVKSSFLDGRVDLTVSGYEIRQTNIITRDPGNPNVAVQGGEQSSHGVEFALSAAATPQLTLDVNIALVDAQYDELLEAGGADRSGNTPTNVPDTVVNLFASYQLRALPMKLTAGLRRSSDMFGDTANTVAIDGFTVLDASIGYTFAFGDLTLRVKNLTDELYIEQGGARTIYIGAPRTTDLTFRTRF